MVVDHTHTSIDTTLWVQLVSDGDDVMIVHTSPLTSVSLTLTADHARWLAQALTRAAVPEIIGPPVS